MFVQQVSSRIRFVGATAVCIETLFQSVVSLLYALFKQLPQNIRIWNLLEPPLGCQDVCIHVLRVVTHMLHKKLAQAL